MKMKIVIIGNGILALTTSYKLAKKDPKVKIEIIGPNEKEVLSSLQLQCLTPFAN